MERRGEEWRGYGGGIEKKMGGWRKGGFKTNHEMTHEWV